jgi:hypothetical protein
MLCWRCTSRLGPRPDAVHHRSVDLQLVLRYVCMCVDFYISARILTWTLTTQSLQRLDKTYKASNVSMLSVPVTVVLQYVISLCCACRRSKCSAAICQEAGLVPAQCRRVESRMENSSWRCRASSCLAPGEQPQGRREETQRKGKRPRRFKKQINGAGRGLNGSDTAAPSTPVTLLHAGRCGSTRRRRIAGWSCS